MPSLTSPKPFAEAAIAAFPLVCRALAQDAVRILATSVDDSYRQPSSLLRVLGDDVCIPDRLHFEGLLATASEMRRLSPAARCLLTRATDGHLRQQAVRALLDEDAAWAVPFVVLLAGDYVVDIAEEIVAVVPTLNVDACSDFVRENRRAMRLLRARATSYWNCYYREIYPDRRRYPGLIVLDQLEQGAN